MDNKELNAAVNQLVELMDESFGLPGYKDYIKENFFMAVEVLKNSGNIYDLDAMVALSKALGMDVSYGFYSFYRFFLQPLLRNIGSKRRARCAAYLSDRGRILHLL